MKSGSHLVQLRWMICSVGLVLMLAVIGVRGDDELERVVRPNYRQAAQYSSSYVRQFLYDTSVSPNWIGETDQFWYRFRDSHGTHYYLVDPAKATKAPLFDEVKLAAQLSEVIRKPLDPSQLTLSRAELDDEGTVFQFVTENLLFEYDLKTEVLTKIGEAPSRGNTETRSGRQLSQQEIQRLIQERQRQQQSSGGRSSDPNAHRSYSPDRTAYVFAKGHNLYLVEVPEDVLQAGFEAAAKEAEEEGDSEEGVSEEGDGDNDGDQDDGDQDDGDQDDGDQDDGDQDDGDQDDGDQDDGDQDDGDQDDGDQDDGDQDDGDQDDGDQDDGDDTNDGDQQDGDGQQDQDDGDDDGTEDDGEEQDDGEKDDEEKDDEEQDDDEETDDDEESDEDGEEEDEELPLPKLALELDDTAVQLTDDGEEDLSFAGRSRGRGGRGSSEQSETIDEDRKTRPSVSWSEDSKYFYVSRRDSRGVEQLWVINSLSDPRPTLESYDYPMPGEEDIRTSELHTFKRESQEFQRVPPVWVDESYSTVSFTEESGILRFLRRDRLLRNIQLCELNLETGELHCLLEEGFENAHIAPQTAQFLENTDEFIWWSERSGWGHFYLYNADGTLKNQITSGQFRASRITSIDEENRTIYFTGNAREEGENVYFNHLYCVRFDGTGLKLMDPGNANHSSQLSPSKQFIVDNCSRVDMCPVSILRNSDGETIMELESADLTRLGEIGWQMPDTFVVKAADGVTDLYGNMWKPFDFDPMKQYPIIAHVYPGPQTEGTRHTFSAVAGEQQLAQLGFIVIQVGHRGGTPTRSKAYGRYGYLNLRDYGLADKKAAIEQLAQRFPFIDVERVGIYGHSGGGFMTAAALLREPYNEFFKVGVSTAGNHDNNIYNNSWSERYHGLRRVEVEEESRGERGQRSNGRRGGDQEEDGEEEEESSSFSVEASDYFYEYELRVDEDADDLDRWHDQAWWDIPEYGQDGENRQDGDQDEEKQDDGDDDDGDEDDGDGEDGDGEDGDGDGDEDQEDGDTEEEEDDELARVRFEIEVPTNAELAENLKGHLFLIHGELDNNVHPANTLRLVDALIKADKRFDMLYLPATRHGFGQYQPYVTQRMYEYFAEHLLDDYQSGADIGEKQTDD